jgi:hypothetical protein
MPVGPAPCKVSSRAELGTEQSNRRAPKPPTPASSAACLDYTLKNAWTVSLTAAWTPQDHPRTSGLYYTRSPLPYFLSPTFYFPCFDHSLIPLCVLHRLCDSISSKPASEHLHLDKFPVTNCTLGRLHAAMSYTTRRRSQPFRVTCTMLLTAEDNLPAFGRLETYLRILDTLEPLASDSEHSSLWTRNNSVTASTLLSLTPSFLFVSLSRHYRRLRPSFRDVQTSHPAARHWAKDLGFSAR